jgi:hypothetical protein
MGSGSGSFEWIRINMALPHTQWEYESTLILTPNNGLNTKKSINLTSVQIRIIRIDPYWYDYPRSRFSLGVQTLQ